MNDADRERWADDHWDFQERIGAEPREDDTPVVHDPTEDDHDPTPDDYYDRPNTFRDLEAFCRKHMPNDPGEALFWQACADAYDEHDVFERSFTNRYGRL